MTSDKLKKVKFINDPVYGVIAITQIERELIDTSIFQRLRGLRQLARVNFVFPGAEHSRYVHSLGVLYIMGLMTEHLLTKDMLNEDDVIKMRIAALLHDIGHYPLSHLGEGVYSYLKEIELANEIIVSDVSDEKKHMYEIASSHSKKAHHELLGKYIIANNNEIVSILSRNGIDPNEIGEIITGEYGSRNMIYTQLLHSSLDADRLDYLLRDSYQTGVKYGLVDLQYLIRLLMVVDDPFNSKSEIGKTLVCNKKGQHVVEHFLMSRYFHYSQIIHHKTNASFEGMIKCLYTKLVQNHGFMYNSYEEIKAAVNDEQFYNFNDSFLDVALKDYYDKTDDEEYKCLYEIYRDRIRSKVIFETKDLYDSEPRNDVAYLERILKSEPDKITSIVGSDRWGYQIVPISIEKIHYSYAFGDKNPSDEDLREAVKLYNPDDGKVSYLAADKLSIVSKLSNFTSKFIRIYVMEEKGKVQDYEKMHRDIDNMIHKF